MKFEVIITLVCVVYLATVCYLLYRKRSRTEDATREAANNWANRTIPSGQELHGNESSDAGKISDDEKKYKRQQLIRGRLEYRQISSTLSPLSDTISKKSEYQVQEIRPQDLESGVTPVGISQTALRQLTKMGYDATVCEKALKAVGGSDVEAAVYWIFEHKANKSSHSKDECPPEGVPIIKSWEGNSDGGIRGQIYGSSNFEDGDFVDTSKIVTGVIKHNSVVATKSGNRYFLSAESANIAFDDYEISTHSRLDSTNTRLDECRHDCVSCRQNRRDSANHSVHCVSCPQSRRDSANHSVRSRLDSLDSIHSRRDSASHDARCRKDSLDSMHSRRDSASYGARCRKDSLDSTNHRVDIDSTTKSTQSFSTINGTNDPKSREICSICLEPYRAGDIVVRLKQKQKVKDVDWFQDTLAQLKNRTSNPNYNEDAGSNHWFNDIVAQLKEATEEIQQSNSKPYTCNHWFHEECLLGWLEKSDECPLCRINMLKD